MKTNFNSRINFTFQYCFRLFFLNRLQFSGFSYCISRSVWRFSYDHIWCFYKAQVRSILLINQTFIPWFHSFSIYFSSIPSVLSWLKYISWLKYANEAMTIVQWEGVTNISNAAILIIWVLFINLVYSSFAACNLDAQICLQSAEDIFDQYDFTEDDFDMDFYALILLYVAFNVFAFLLLWLRVRKY